MPQAVDITVKNGATTPVNKTFSLISPAAGDSGIALWALKEGVISGAFPQLTAQARVTKTSRVLKVKFRLPSSYVEAATGRTLVGSRAEMNVDFTIPEDFPEAQKSDFVAFSVNLLSSTLLMSMIRDAYPAT